MKSNMNITTASGVINLLAEEETALKVFALEKLNILVDMFWAEISESIDKVEVLYEDSGFKHRNLAALVASKVYYHLGDFDDSLTYALGAGTLFNVNEASEFVETIISKAIDHYKKVRVANIDVKENEQKAIDERLENIVNLMFKRCFDDKQFKQAIGIGLETRRIDIVEQAIKESNDVNGMLSYTFKVCMSLIQNRKFRNTILNILTRLYMGLGSPDYINVCQCYIFLEDPESVAAIIEQLLQGTEDQVLMAYQIAFDLYDSASQQFLQRILSALRKTSPVSESSAAKDEKEKPAAEGEDMETDQKEAPTEKVVTMSDEEKVLQTKIAKIKTILTGEMTIALNMQFLIKNNKSDLLILKNTKDAVRNSVCHSSTVIANAFMHCGTTSDKFLRDNLEWLARATNWAKFTATASLGVIHKGHEKEALNLMSTYLPKDSNPGSAYSEGGGLYALGLIHANHGGEIMDYLLNQLKEATTDMVRHGACLGLGLAAMGTARQDIYEQLKFNLYQDDAVTGEAAGLGMGLVMLGTKSSTAIEEMVLYAQETQHEKILRGLALGIALTMYGRLEEADALIESLTRDKDPILRWSGMYTIAMAYCGSGNNEAVRKLLHVAVSDVNDDVRRCAVTSLGFLLFKTPEQCPSVVSLLSESYNPHVRFGAAMALGICCAGTGMKEALALLEPMVNDPVNYVRQGSLIASAMILTQHNENTCSKMSHFRQLYAKVISDKHEDVMAKFGAILAQGIIDAGGRNMTLSLQSKAGHTDMAAVVGTLVFTQYWFWYPLTYFLCLAFKPTSLIALNADLKMPKIEFKSNAKPSMYAYPPPLEEKKDKTKEKVETAVLSITSKQKKKDGEKKKDKPESMEVEEKDDTKDSKEKEKDSKDQEAKEKDTKEKETKEKETKEKETKDKETKDKETKDKETKEKEKTDAESEKKKEPEPSFEMLTNPARVMKAQLKHIAMTEGCRYSSIKDISHGGFVILRNSKPADDEDIVETLVAGGPKIEEEEDEPEPPEPFEYTED